MGSIPGSKTLELLAKNRGGQPSTAMVPINPVSFLRAMYLYLRRTGPDEGAIERKLVIWSQGGLVLKPQDLHVKLLSSIKSEGQGRRG